jgi:hypothetical protein
MKLEGGHPKLLDMKWGWPFFFKLYTRPYFLLIKKQETGPYFPSVERFTENRILKSMTKKMHFGGIEPGPLDQILHHYPITHSKALKQC